LRGERGTAAGAATDGAGAGAWGATLIAAPLVRSSATSAMERPNTRQCYQNLALAMTGVCGRQV